MSSEPDKCTGCLRLGVLPHMFCPVCIANGNDYDVAMWRFLLARGMLSDSAPKREPKRTMQKAGACQ